MKRSVYTIGSLIILLIAAFIFVLVPIFQGGKMGKRLPVFGKYDGTEIRYEQDTDFYNYVARYAEYYKNQGIEIKDSAQFYLFNYAFNATVTELAYKKAVAKAGYKVPETAINRAIKPYFVDENGNFSQKLYNISVSNNSDSVASLRNQIASTLTTSRYAEDSFGGQTALGNGTLYGLKTSTAEADFIHKMGNGQRSFNMAVFNMSDYPDSEKIAFGKANAEKFVKYDFSVITVSDKAKAASILKRINENAITFEDAVNESQKIYSNDSGKINSKYHYQIEKFLKQPADMEKLAALEEGAVSEPLQTSVGYSIFKADSAKAEPDFSDNATVRTVYNYLTANEFSHIEDYYKETAKAFSSTAKSRGFNAAVNQYNAKKVNVPEFALNYGGLSVLTKLDTTLDGLSGADTNKNFLTSVFSLKDGELSEPITNGNNILVLQIAKNNVAAQEPIPAEALNDELTNYDVTSAQTALLSSPKLVNNVQDVFYKYFMTNN
ncbi:MAG: SurA N-terminal domain-containing protein [Treponema sp.]|jgi:hypothetical protein|nr:SurA N-terminal domain-containing protein [Treponema sp.]